MWDKGEPVGVDVPVPDAAARPEHTGASRVRTPLARRRRAVIVGVACLAAVALAAGVLSVVRPAPPAPGVMQALEGQPQVRYSRQWSELLGHAGATDGDLVVARQIAPAGPWLGVEAVVLRDTTRPDFTALGGWTLSLEIGGAGTYAPQLRAVAVIDAASGARLWSALVSPAGLPVVFDQAGVVELNQQGTASVAAIRDPTTGDLRAQVPLSGRVLAAGARDGQAYILAVEDGRCRVIVLDIAAAQQWPLGAAWDACIKSDRHSDMIFSPGASIEVGDHIGVARYTGTVFDLLTGEQVSTAPAANSWLLPNDRVLHESLAGTWRLIDAAGAQVGQGEDFVVWDIAPKPGGAAVAARCTEVPQAQSAAGGAVACLHLGADDTLAGAASGVALAMVNVGSPGAAVAAYDMAGGSRMWQAPLGGYLSDVVGTDRGRALLNVENWADASGRLVNVDLGDGTVLWEHPLPSNVLLPATVIALPYSASVMVAGDSTLERWDLG